MRAGSVRGKGRLRLKDPTALDAEKFVLVALCLGLLGLARRRAPKIECDEGPPRGGVLSPKGLPLRRRYGRAGERAKLAMQDGPHGNETVDQGAAPILSCRRLHKGKKARRGGA